MVSLLEDTAVLCYYGCQETKKGILPHGDVLLVLFLEAAFKVAKDNGPRLDAD